MLITAGLSAFCLAIQKCVCVWSCYMNPFRRYVPFCYRPLPLPRPLLANWHEHKHTPSHTHTVKRGEFLWTDQQLVKTFLRFRIRVLFCEQSDYSQIGYDVTCFHFQVFIGSCCNVKKKLLL